MSGGDHIDDVAVAPSSPSKRKVKRNTSTDEPQSRHRVSSGPPDVSIPTTIQGESPQCSSERPPISPRKSAVTRTKVPTRRPSSASTSTSDPTRTASSADSPETSSPPSSTSTRGKMTQGDVEEARINAQKRVRERKLREQQDRQKELLKVDPPESPRRRRSGITPEEGRARAIARVRLRELQKKTAAIEGSPTDDETSVAHISIKQIMSTLDMDAESCRSYLLGGLKDHDDDHSMASSSIATRRSATIPKGPNFLLHQKYGPKGSPRKTDSRNMMDPSDDASSLAQSTVAFVGSLRDSEEHSTWYEGRITIPSPPKFHGRKSSRPPPKSTEELELEKMKQKQFKARPVPSTSAKRAGSEPPSTTRTPMTRCPSVDSVSSSKPKRSTSKSATETTDVDSKTKPSFRSRVAATRPSAHLSEARRIAKSQPA